jgi:predicted RND superfamily exporter protein
MAAKFVRSIPITGDWESALLFRLRYRKWIVRFAKKLSAGTESFFYIFLYLLHIYLFYFYRRFILTLLNRFRQRIQDERRSEMEKRMTYRLKIHSFAKKIMLVCVFAFVLAGLMGLTKHEGNQTYKTKDAGKELPSSYLVKMKMKISKWIGK